jgi:hypothetical protein
MKYFNTPGMPPLYSGVTAWRPEDLRMASANGRNDFRFLGVERRRKYFLRQFREIEHVERDFQLGINFFDEPGDFARVAVRAIGTDEQGDHCGTRWKPGANLARAGNKNPAVSHGAAGCITGLSGAVFSSMASRNRTPRILA